MLRHVYWDFLFPLLVCTFIAPKISVFKLKGNLINYNEMVTKLTEAQASLKLLINHSIIKNRTYDL